MSLSYFPRIQNWLIHASGWRETLDELALDGKRANEGIVLWLGKRKEELGIITQLFFLRGPGIIKQPNFLMISADLMNQVTEEALRLEVKLLGQAHSHGSSYYTDLSHTDIEGGIAFPHYLSIVVPDYGLRKETCIADCGVHIFEEGGRFRRFSRGESRSRISLDKTTSFGITEVG